VPPQVCQVRPPRWWRHRGRQALPVDGGATVTPPPTSMSTISGRPIRTSKGVGDAPSDRTPALWRLSGARGHGS